MSRLQLLTLSGLGALHGLNPGMGWLFAVAFGLQERSRRAVVAALGPIAAGHAVAIATALAVLAAAQTLLSPRRTATACALLLVGFGGWHLLRRRHPRRVGMRLRPHELALWSFVMASVHGAGLMLFPVLLDGRAPPGEADHPVTGLAAATLGGTTAATAAAVHTAAMLVAMGGVAIVVYDRVGLGILRRAWINVDLIWAAALVTAGVSALFL